MSETCSENRERYRHMIVAELINSEENYLEDLRFLKQVWLFTLLLPSSKVSSELKSKLSEISKTIEVIESVHEMFQSELKNTLSPFEKSAGGIGRVFYHYQGPFNIYSLYITQFEEIKHIVGRSRSTSHFEFISRSVGSHSACRHGEFIDYLVLPVQRVSVYSLFLKRFLENSSLEDEDRKDLENASEALQRISANLSEKLDQYQSQSKLETLQKLFPKDIGIIAPGRYFVTQGLFKTVETNGFLEIYLFLFNDLFLAAIGDPETGFQLQWSITLDSKCKLVDMGSFYEKHMLLLSDSKSVVICVPEDHLLKKWCGSMKLAVSRLPLKRESNPISTYPLPAYLKQRDIAQWGISDVCIWLYCSNFEEIIILRFCDFRVDGNTLIHLLECDISIDMFLGDELTKQILQARNKLIATFAAEGMLHPSALAFRNLDLSDDLSESYMWSYLAEFVCIPIRLITLDDARVLPEFKIVFRIVLNWRDPDSKKREHFISKNFVDFERFEQDVRQNHISQFALPLPDREKFILSFRKAQILEEYLQILCGDPSNFDICSEFLQIPFHDLKNAFDFQNRRKIRESRQLMSNTQTLMTHSLSSLASHSPAVSRRDEFIMGKSPTVIEFKYSLSNLIDHEKKKSQIGPSLKPSELLAVFNNGTLANIKSFIEEKDLQDEQMEGHIINLIKGLENFLEKLNVEHALIVEALSVLEVSKWQKVAFEPLIANQVSSNLVREFLSLFGPSMDYLDPLTITLMRMRECWNLDWGVPIALSFIEAGMLEVNINTLFQLVHEVPKEAKLIKQVESLVGEILQRSIKARFYFLLELALPSSLTVTNIYGMSSQYRRGEVSFFGTIGWTKFKLQFQRYPEFPSIHSIVLRLSELLFGSSSPIPFCELFRINSAPVVISPEILGPTVRSYHSTVQEHYNASRTFCVSDVLDFWSVSANIILAILTNPEDAGPNEYIMEKDHNKQEVFKIFYQNAGRSFVHSSEVRCFLFYLDHMRKPVHPGVIRAVLRWKVEDFIFHWVRNIATLNQQILNDGFTSNELEFARRRSSFLAGVLSIQSMIQVYEKLTIMQYVLCKDQWTTHLHLLRYLEPRIKVEDYIWPDEVVAFDQQCGKSASSPSQFLSKVVNGDYSLDYLHKVLSGDRDSPANAMNFLVNMFYKLLESKQLQIDFSRIDHIICSTEKDQSLDRLRFLNLCFSKEIKDTKFWESVCVPGFLSRVYSLQMIQCQGLTSEIIDRIGAGAMGLEILDLTGSTGITRIGGPAEDCLITFPRLREVKLSDMDDLEICLIRGSLNFVEVRSCKNLRYLVIESSDKLDFLDIRGSNCDCKLNGVSQRKNIEKNTFGIELGIQLQKSLKELLGKVDLSICREEYLDVSLTDDVRIRVLRPIMFHRILNLFRESRQSLIASICDSDPLVGEVSKAKSESLFYRTNDGKFLLKSMKPEEWNLLNTDLLGSYVQHMKDSRNTLLPRFFLCFRIRTSRDVRNFIIMNNVFHTPLEIHEVFDLKGSSIAREVTLDEIRRNRRGVVWKDIDWDRKRYKLQIEDELKDLLATQINMDVSFLKNHGLMDYSLLIGLSYTPHSYRKIEHSFYFLPVEQYVPDMSKVSPDSKSDLEALHEAWTRNMTLDFESIFKRDAGGIQGTEPAGGSLPLHYFIGIIDILQAYDIKKFAERTVKTTVVAPISSQSLDDISCVEPPVYYERFMKRILRLFEDIRT